MNALPSIFASGYDEIPERTAKSEPKADTTQGSTLAGLARGNDAETPWSRTAVRVSTRGRSIRSDVAMLILVVTALSFIGIIVTQAADDRPLPLYR